MRIEDISPETEETFFRCLHNEVPVEARSLEMRRRWYEDRRGKGLRAKVLILDDGQVGGLCQSLPIEHSQFLGEDLMAILCIWVHGYNHLVGNQQGRGYGRLMLQHIEDEARRAGAKGVTAWGMDPPYWNPVSFYEHMGYQRADQNGTAVLVWKPFCDDAVAPRMLRQIKTPPAGDSKVRVSVFVNAWCPGGSNNCVCARDVARACEKAEYEEIDTSDRETMLSWGIDNGIFVDGVSFRWGVLWTADELREEIIARGEDSARGAE